MSVITAARIVPASDMFTPPRVLVIMEGESNEQFLFDYFPDEISFTADEFLGLTEEEARCLKFKKDNAFLRS